MSSVVEIVGQTSWQSPFLYSVIAAAFFSWAMTSFANAVVHNQKTILPVLLKLPVIYCLFKALSPAADRVALVAFTFAVGSALFLTVVALARAKRLRYTDPVNEVQNDTFSQFQTQPKHKD